MKILKKISNVLDMICGAAIVVMVALMVIVTFAQIVWRVGSGFISWMRPLSWSEEVTRFLLVWSTFYGATCAYYHGSNIAITAVQGAVPAPVQKVMRVIVHIVCLVLFIAVAYYGFTFCSKQPRMTDALPVNVPMKYIYSCIPISMVILSWHALVMMLSEIFDKKEAN